MTADDLTTTYGGPPSEGVATVAAGDELSLFLSVPAVILRGALESDGTIGLAGMTTDSDAAAGGTCSFGQHCRLDIGGVLPREADDDPTPGTYSYQFDEPLFPVSGGTIEVTRLGALP